MTTWLTVCTADGEVHTLPADFSALRNVRKSVYIHSGREPVEQLKTPISFLFEHCQPNSILNILKNKFISTYMV